MSHCGKIVNVRVVSVNENMPNSVALNGLGDLFKLCGDSAEIGILLVLSEFEMCGCDLCALLKMKQPAVSHQLKNLKQSQVVKSRKGSIQLSTLKSER